jgi:cyclopropane fatty-acyl-phospholipid synthase-like methyltransferase
VAVTGDLAAAGRTWRSFAGSGPAARLWVAARLAVLPMGALHPELRALSGRVLSVGCGHGAIERYLAEVNPAVTVEGVELDATRVAAAARSAGRAPRVRLHAGDARRLDGGPYDAALAVDVLHHLDPAGQEALAVALAAAVAPGGPCLVKDIGRLPAWKHRVNAWHDRLVAGGPVHCRTPEAMAALFDGAGFDCERILRCDHRSPYPHYLLRLRRRA